MAQYQRKIGGPFAFAHTALAANITYNVNETVGAGSVTGTITTDGNTGTLTTADILNWNLNLSDGVHTFDLLGPLSGNNSAEQISNSALTATATQLSYNFASGTYDSFLFENPGVGDNGPGVCWTNSVSGCIDLSATGAGVGVTAEAPETTFVYTNLSGTQVIASVTTTPEPGAAVLSLTGIGLVVLLRKRLLGR